MTLTDQQRRRYARHLVLAEIGEAGQRKLLGAKVLVVGAGGLGAPLIAYLAASGVGTLGIVDGDRVELSNLARQVIYETGDIGRLKVEAAKDRAEEINPEARIVIYKERLTEQNAEALIGAYDVVADGSDNFATRHLVNATCYRLRKPLVSAAIAGFTGQLSTFKAYQGAPHPCYRCFVAEGLEDTRTCAESGVLSPLAGVMGSLQAVEVIKEILGLGDSLSGRVLFYDALAASFREATLPRDPKCAVCSNSLPS